MLTYRSPSSIDDRFKRKALGREEKRGEEGGEAGIYSLFLYPSRFLVTTRETCRVLTLQRFILTNSNRPIDHLDVFV